MGTEDKIVKKWLAERLAEQRIIDGTASDHEVLGAIAGVPPQAIALVEKRQAILVLAARIERWWASIPEAERPAYATMQQFLALFGSEQVGAWQIGNALRYLGWQSSRRSWKEGVPRARLWTPPERST